MRKQRNTVDYFPHDSRASLGNTLTILQSRFGNNGYAVWFKLLEKLASADGHFLDCRNKLFWKMLVAQLGVDEQTTVEMVDLLVEIEAVDGELWSNRVIWCQKLVDNIADVYKNRRREVPTRPLITEHNGFPTEHNGFPTGRKAITTGQSTQSKVKESKVKEIILTKKPYGSFSNVLLSDAEYQKLKDRFNSNLTEKIERLSAGIAAKGYKYKSHYAAILVWERKDENEKGGIGGKTTPEHSRNRTSDWPASVSPQED